MECHYLSAKLASHSYCNSSLEFVLPKYAVVKSRIQNDIVGY